MLTEIFPHCEQKNQYCKLPVLFVELETIVFGIRLKTSKLKELLLHKKRSFPLIISPVNVTKSAVYCAFGHIY